MDLRGGITTLGSVAVGIAGGIGLRRLVAAVVLGVLTSTMLSVAYAKGTRGAIGSRDAAGTAGNAVFSVPPLIDSGVGMESVSAPPKTPPLMLLYNPMRASELSIFSGPAQRFIQLARPLRPTFNEMPSREKVQFLERYVFAMCNSHLVNGMDVVFKMETGTENFCGYSPGMLNCFAADKCDEATYADTVKYIKGSLAKFDKFVKWSDHRKWQYRGDALRVSFYTRNTLTKSGMICATLKLVNDNEEQAIVRMRASLRSADGRLQTVFSRPYYVGPKSSLPNLSDENLFSKDTEARMRKLTADAQAMAKRAGILDIQAYTGTHERWNCFPSPKPDAQRAEFQQVFVEFPK